MKKVIIAMSGGVDSSVGAALLKKQGYEVVGVFLNLGQSFDKKRAQQVAKKLAIPFYAFDLRKEFKSKIVDYFLKNYKIGLTPNPCVVCNKEIKFGFLFEKLKALGADYIATGHYARLVRGILLQAKDKEKDQSYFLWKLNQKILKKTLFPIGDYTKTEIKKLARKFKLPVLDIPESQEICFIQTSTADFLKKHIKPKPGSIIDLNERVLGQHQGLWFYTIGQRKRIELPSGPFYVVDKNIKRNALIISRNEKDLYKKELIAKNINWIPKKEPKFPLKVMAKIRYRHDSAPAMITKEKNKIKVVFSRPQRAITPGQSVVFYRNQEVLGGGIIIK